MGRRSFDSLMGEYNRKRQRKYDKSYREKHRRFDYTASKEAADIIERQSSEWGLSFKKTIDRLVTSGNNS